MAAPAAAEEAAIADLEQLDQDAKKRLFDEV
jgi:hypothetical protein